MKRVNGRKRTSERNDYIDVNQLAGALPRLNENSNQRSINKYIRKAAAIVLDMKTQPTPCELNRVAGWLIGYNYPTLSSTGDGTSDTFIHIKSAIQHQRKQSKLAQQDADQRDANQDVEDDQN